MLPELAGMECIIQCLACYNRETEVGHTFQFPLMYERKTPLKLSLKIFLSRLVSTYKKVFLSQNFNPLTPGAFCKNTFFGHFGPVFRLDLGQISFTLIENAFARWQFALLAASRSRFTAFWLARGQKSKIFWTREWPTSLGLSIFEIFFRLCFFFFSFLFAAVIDLLLGLLAVKKLLRKRHRDGQFLPWSSQVQEILAWVFHSTFWAFLCLSQAPFGRSLWSGHH